MSKIFRLAGRAFRKGQRAGQVYRAMLCHLEILYRKAPWRSAEWTGSIDSSQIHLRCAADPERWECKEYRSQTPATVEAARSDTDEPVRAGTCSRSSQRDGFRCGVGEGSEPRGSN